MKTIATACALLVLALILTTKPVAAQKQNPSVEYSAVWDATQNRWRDTVQTFTMSYTPEYTVTSRSAKYQTTYSGFTPVTSDVYQSRFFWAPDQTYSQVRVDSIHMDGSLSPVRLDLYDRSMPGKTSFTRSAWTGTEWKPVQTSTSMTDTLGILRSSVNHSAMSGELVLTDSTHIDVTQDIKGNVLKVKLSQWTIADQTLQTIAEQRNTLAGDGSISVAELWNTDNGDLAPALRLHGFDWAVRDKSFPYVQRELGAQLLYGGDGYRAVSIDIPSGGDWAELYQVQQSFDEKNRLTSYIFDGMTRDTFSFDNELLSLNQHDQINGSSWSTDHGTRTIYDVDANGTLRSVTSQRFNANTSAYVNERIYWYAFGTAGVEPIAASTHLTLYPNPTEKLISIGSSEPVLEASIISTTGAVLMQSASASIDVSHLPAGAYGVRVRTKSGEETLRFVKSH